MTETKDAPSKQTPSLQADQIRSWIGVVGRDHARRSVNGGIVTLEQGKLGPLIRLNPGDWLIFYSPRTTGTNGQALQAFTAMGRVVDAEPYQAEFEPGKNGFCRDIDWLDVNEVALSDLNDKLDFTRGSWGMLARRGLFEITDADRQAILAAMAKE